MARNSLGVNVTGRAIVHRVVRSGSRSEADIAAKVARTQKIEAAKQMCASVTRRVMFVLHARKHGVNVGTLVFFSKNTLYSLV